MSFYHAFISYGRADSKAFATKLYNRLCEKDLNIWFDQNDIPLAVDFQEQINDGIARADNFIFIIAPHSVNSPYCLKEIELALHYRKRIIPLLHVEQISHQTWQTRHPEAPDADWQTYQAKGLHSSFPNMHPEIGKINWIYFREDSDEFETSLEGLIATFQHQVTYVNQHTVLLNQALEWERQQKQTRYLLTGENRKAGESWLNTRFKNEQPPCTPTDLHCEFITESIKNANNLMTQVFLAHAEADIVVMETVRNSLRREGFTVWTSQSDIQTGEAFEDAIRRGIEQADNLVYLLSPDSQTSHYCRQELDYGLQLNKRIIPILVRPTAPEDIPPALRALQYIDLTDNVGETDYVLDESQLLKILQQDAAYHEEHKILLTRALKWQQQHHNPSILLRGYNLRSADAWWKIAQQRQQQLPTPLQEQFLTASLQQPPLSSLDVFISYSRTDADFARKLNDALQLQGKTTWFDQESIATGADFQQEIYRGIETADNFLFILSPQAVNSPYCADEVEYAAKLSKRVVTVLSQPVQTVGMHDELARVQWIDFNPQTEDFNTSFNQLVRTLDTDRDHVHNHTKWSQRALEWSEKGKSEDLLLRGSEFAIAQYWWQRAQSVRKQPLVTALQQEFISRSQQAIEAGKKQEKRRVATLWATLAGMSSALVLAVSFGIIAFHAFQEANKQKKIANLRAEAYQVETLMEREPVESLVRSIHTFSASKDQQDVEMLLHLVKANLHRAAIGVRERNRFQDHENLVRSVAFSPDGQMIISGSEDNTVRLWDLQGNPIGQPFTGHRSTVWSVAFSPDGQTIISGSEDKTVRLWDLQGNPIGQPLTGHTAWVRAVAFSPDGQTIVSGSDDKTVRLWDLQGNPVAQPFTGHGLTVWSVAFSPDGQTIISGSGDKTVRLWDLQGNPVAQSFTGHGKRVTSVAFSPDGQTIASGSDDKTVRLWDLQGNPVARPFTGHENRVTSVAFSPDGQTIVSGSEDKTVRMWDLRGKSIGKPFTGHTAWVTSLAFSPDGQALVTGGDDKTVRLWDLQDNPSGQSFIGHGDRVTSVAFSRDGQTIVSGSDDKTVRLWDLQSNPVGQPFTGHEDRVTSVAFSPNGKTIVSGSGDKTLRLWNVKGDLVGEPFIGHQRAIRAVAFSPDGQTIVSGAEDKTLRLWNLQGTPLGQPFTGHKHWVRAVAFSPDGQTIASGSFDNTVRLWDLQGNLIGQPFTGHKHWVISVAFSPDGQMIASASGDNTLRLWDLQGNSIGQPFIGHEDWARAVAFSPDGQTIVSGSGDKTVRLWDLQGNPIGHPFIGHKDVVWSVAFSPDGQTVVSGSRDSTMRLWRDLTLQDWLRRGCQQVRLHPVLVYPDAEFADISPEAVKTCINAGTWSDAEIAQFRVRQGWTLARLDADVPGALERFQQALQLDARLDLAALTAQAKQLAEFARAEATDAPAQ